MSLPPPHIPVLLEETVSNLVTDPDGIYLDGTAGCGGHSAAILQRLSSKGKLIIMDLDSYALDSTRQRLATSKRSFSLHHGNFRDFPLLLNSLEIDSLTGALFDIGYSSSQIDTGYRGFSFQAVAPLDMRFNPESGQSARDFLNHAPEAEIASVLHEYGEERHYRNIAQAVSQAVKSGKMETTIDLKNAVNSVISGRFLTKSLARVFQAVRIKVNDELGALKEALSHSVNWLATGGRMAVISFHSLEDRIVKQYYRDCAKTCICPREYPVCTCNIIPTLKPLSKRAIVPQQNECAANPRARSAKLRVAERI